MRRALLLALFALVLWVPRAEAIVATLRFPSASSGTTQYGSLCESGGTYGPACIAATFLTVSTDVNATCKWDTANVAYASMANTFYNTGGWTWHATKWSPSYLDVGWPNYTYYWACKDDGNSNTTSTVSVAFTVDHTYPGTVAANLYGFALSSTRAQLGFSNPVANGTVTNFKIYRDAVLVYNDSQSADFIDTGLTADTTYTYTARVTISGVDQTLSPGYRVHTLPTSAVFSSSAAIPVLENFESGNTTVDAGASNDWEKYLWNDYPYGDIAGTGYGDAVLSMPTVAGKDGTHAFLMHMTGTYANPPYSHANSMYFTMLPFTQPDNVRHFAREYLKTGTWAFNTFNRMRVWVKMPSTWLTQTAGYENLQVGTYVRSSHGDSGGSGAEESGIGGTHYYHLYNIPYTDQWYQIIVDTHPSHQRGANGNKEWTNHAYVTGEPGWTYFDALSRFYLDTACCSNTPQWPSDYYVDAIDFFYEDDTTSGIDHVYSLHGGYNLATTTVYVGWDHPKDDDTTKADVRYAFSDLHALGFTNGTIFPGTTGGVSPQGAGPVYSTMLVSSAAISTTGHSSIFVGIRAQGDTGFRQIEIPLEATPDPPAPSTAVGRLGKTIPKGGGL